MEVLMNHHMHVNIVNIDNMLYPALVHVHKEHMLTSFSLKTLCTLV